MAYLIVGVESNVAWPTVETPLRFEGAELLLRPAQREHDLAATIVCPIEKIENAEQAAGIVRRFLSALAWVEGASITEVTSCTAGHPIGLGNPARASVITPDFVADYLPSPQDPRTRLALALYREALGLNSIPYQFLGFYKVLNVIHRHGPAQKAWVNQHVDRAVTSKRPDDRDARRLADLRAKGLDVGAYLYESGRCAVAHAFEQPVVDPDEPTHIARLRDDLPLARSLAEWAIEHELGVKSRATVYAQHLYELEGFQRIVGSEIVSAITAGVVFPCSSIPRFPKLSIRLRRCGHLAAFESMRAQVEGVEPGRVRMTCSTSDGLVRLPLVLDFREQRLLCDPIGMIEVRDDGSLAAVEYLIDHCDLVTRLLRNGVIEVWDSTAEVRLGRKDPLVPDNINPRATFENLAAKRTTLDEERTRRMRST